MMEPRKLILNLGCGTRVSNSPDIVNVDRSLILRLKRASESKVFSRLLTPLLPLFLDGDRLQRFHSYSGNNILIHNLANGIPFESASVDMVYNSHMLEHLDRPVAERFLAEARRVLKPGGIHRIVVPDFEKMCRTYIAHVEYCDANPCRPSDRGDPHDSYIAPIIEQSVRREASGMSRQPWMRRLIEGLLVGDARRRGETHQWMYDRISLKEKLVCAGYEEVRLQDYQSSLLRNWADYGLDVDENGREYKPGSLYMEALRGLGASGLEQPSFRRKGRHEIEQHDVGRTRL